MSVLTRPGPLAGIWEVWTVSIVRVGLAETKKFADGYDAIFGKKTNSGGTKAKKPAKKPAGGKAKKKKKK